MYFHWQKLGNYWSNARAWLRTRNDNLAFQFEYSFRKHRPELGFMFSTGGIFSNHVTFNINLLFLSLFLGISEKRFLSKIYRNASYSDGIRTEISLEYEGTLKFNLDLASREMAWRGDDPWWKKGIRIDFADLFFGKQRYTKKEEGTEELIIPMPEGSYKGMATKTYCTWKRPLLPWYSYKSHGYTVDIPGGIPHAGKGENSWDCGDDGLYGISIDANDKAEVISKIVQSVLKSRQKYGQASWLYGKEPVMAAPKPEL